MATCATEFLTLYHTIKDSRLWG